MTELLLPYSGDETQCPKCNSHDISMQYRLAATPNSTLWRRTFTKYPEHLECTCTRCGYVWAEACADAKKE